MQNEVVDEALDIKPGQAMFAVLSSHGDLKTIWDKDKPEEVAEARAQFDRLRAKGYVAFKVEGKDGAKGAQIDTFDPTAERMILSPQLRGG